MRFARLQRVWQGVLLATAASWAAGGFACGWAQQENAPPKPADIWPAGLEKLAGRFVFVQVGSPGGLWKVVHPKEGATVSRQIAIDDVEAQLRDRLKGAELVISDLKLPTKVEASEEVSPSKRGKIRRYTETVDGRLAMKNLPGIGGDTDDPGEYSGPVSFGLNHLSHSNPSRFGIQTLRDQQEVTWGTATIDYADLRATVPGKNPKDEEISVIENARVLRGGLEIFAYMEWRKLENGGETLYRGSVRLRKVS
jgi:hypothetical protein